MDPTTAAANLAARDADLADADQRLLSVLRDAHRQARETIRRIEAVRDQIASATTDRRVHSAVHGAEIGRFLLEKNRELLAIVDEAAADAGVKARALEELAARYRASPQR